MPRMRGRLYSSCASSTWSFPSALSRAERRCRGSAACGRRRGLRARSRAPLLRRRELVVDEEHLGVRVGVRRLELLELALADVRPRIAAWRAAGRARRRLDAGGARKLAHSAEPRVGIDASEYGTATTRARARRPGRVGPACVTAGIMPRLQGRCPTSRPGSRRVRSSSSTSSRRAATRRRSPRSSARSSRPRSRRVRARRCVRARRGRGARAGRSSSSPGHCDTVPAQANLPGPDRGRRRARARRERHEGRGRGDDRAARCARRAGRRDGRRPRVALRSARRSSPAESSPLPALFDNARLVARRGARDRARADRQRRSMPAASAT